MHPEQLITIMPNLTVYSFPYTLQKVRYLTTARMKDLPINANVFWGPLVYLLCAGIASRCRLDICQPS